MAMVGFLATLFVGFTALNRFIEGAYILPSDVGIINTLAIFKSITVFGLWDVPVPNVNFFTVGLPHLVKWDYAFFGGDAALLVYFFYAATAALSFIIFGVAVAALSNLKR